MKHNFRFIPIKLFVMAVCSFLMLLGASSVWAGPPFFTDDPEPVDHKHGEIYLASQTSHNSLGTSGTLPHIEINYGLMPNMQVHVITPFAYSKPRGEKMVWGYGDTEFGVKYRFIQEGTIIPQVGTFPLVEFPSGDQKRGLGESHIRAFFPIWVQKGFGPWTVYGGGGYWYNPGPDNRNYWQSGLVLMRELSKTISIGVEGYDFTGRQKGDKNQVGVNIGAVVNITEDHHILLSVGRDITGTNRNTLNAYAAYQFTFGPGKEPEKK
jgi:hypothetical protein